MFLGAKIRTFSHSHNTLDMSFYIPNVWYAKKSSRKARIFCQVYRKRLMLRLGVFSNSSVRISISVIFS